MIVLRYRASVSGRLLYMQCKAVRPRFLLPGEACSVLPVLLRMPSTIFLFLIPPFPAAAQPHEALNPGDHRKANRYQMRKAQDPCLI